MPIKKLAKLIWPYIFVLLVVCVPPICFQSTKIYAITDINEITKVLPSVFANSTFKHLPTVSLILKSINCFCLLLFVFCKPMRKHFSTYVFFYMILITLTQNITYINNKGIVLSTGSFLLMLITCLIWLLKVKKDNTHYTINKHYLWMFSIILLCIWYPLDRHANFNFSLDPWVHYLSSSMYCFNMPVFISFLLIFYKNNYGWFYEVLGIIALLFSLVTIIAQGTWLNGIPNMIMHFPLLISSLTLLFNCYWEKDNIYSVSFKNQKSLN